MESLKEDVKELHLKVDQLSAGNIIAEDESQEGFDYFPINTNEEFLRLNEQLGDTGQHQKCIRTMSTIGGKDQFQLTKRMLKRLRGTQLARTYNLTGSKGKNSFNSLKNIEAGLLKSVKKMFPTSTEKEVSDTIAKWLSSARDRDGGRSARTSATARLEPLPMTEHTEDADTDLFM